MKMITQVESQDLYIDGLLAPAFLRKTGTTLNNICQISLESGCPKDAQTPFWLRLLFLLHSNLYLNLHRLATYYTKVMEKVQSKGDAFITTEIDRLDRLMGKSCMLLRNVWRYITSNPLNPEVE